MGLCPSRNQASSKGAKTYLPQDPPPQCPTPTSALRADAAAFVPKPEKKEKEPWEQFLDQKRIEQLQPKATLARKTDGTFTADYRRLLGDAKEKTKYVPPHLRNSAATPATELGSDWVKEWKEGYQKAPPRAAPGLPKPKNPKKFPVGTGPLAAADVKLREALYKVKQVTVSKTEALAQLEELEAQQAKDDLAAPTALVPFGLTDSHYLSDTDDAKASHRHSSKVPTKLGPYVPKALPLGLEEEIARVLHHLRLLKTAETGAGLTPKRYCVGLREVARALKDKVTCPLKAILVAPDVECDGKLEQRLADLVSAASALKIPVLYGLSRSRIGQAVKKSVTVSVLGILDIRGMQEPFDEMLRAAKR